MNEKKKILESNKANRGDKSQMWGCKLQVLNSMFLI